MAIAPELRAQILRLYQAELWRVGTIARQLHVHRDTVRQVLTQCMYSAPGCQRLASNPESAARAPQPVGWGIKLGGVVLSIHAVIAPCR